MKKDNSLLYKGMLILSFGLLLSAYSISSYVEVKNFAKNVDFELVDENIELSSEEKYYKYLTFADYINQKLNKNRNLPIKNASCTYLNYAQHNALELYRLTNKMDSDIAKRNTANGNIRTLYNIIDNYSTCKSYPEYKTELKNLLTEIEQSANSNIENELRMQKILDDYKNRNSKTQEDSAVQEENLIQEQNSEQTEPQTQTPNQEQ
jgi:hypothetical protein